MPDNANKLSEFWQELKRRRVIHVIVVYATAAFVIIELVNNVAEPMHLPEGSTTFVILLLAIGFPFAIIFSWIFDITPKGIVKTKPIKQTRKQKGDYQLSDKISSFENSIAVLPFQDMSQQKDQEYFCDGMTEEIINVLTHVESLKVIARTSVFAFKDKHKDIREIGNKLDVETILEGSIRKDGNRLRITAQLINVADGIHIWSEAYSRNLEDVFAIQEEISLAIVNTLKVKLLGEEKAAIEKRHTENFEAYMLYLRGRQSRQRKDLNGFNRALEYLEKSLKIDSEFASAYSEIALTYVLMGWFCCIYLDNKLREKIFYYANKALELDDSISDAFIALALTWELFDNDQVKAEKYVRKALTLIPGNPEAIQEHGFILGRMGNFNDAIQRMESTIALDPLSVLANNGLGYTYFYQGQFRSAIKQMQKILALDPDFYPAKYVISLSLVEIGEYQNALLTLSSCPQSNPLVVGHQGYIYAKMGRIDESNKTVEELESLFSEDPLLEFLLAIIYVGLGEIDRAFDSLRKSQTKHGFIYRDRTIGADFRIDSLREDSRFEELNYY